MSDGPMSGVRVLDVSTILAGPLASALLGEFGAEVIKIEHPAEGDPARLYPPLEDGVSAAWTMLGRTKRSVTIDLHHPEAAHLVGRLAAASDIVVTNFRPATLRRFRIDFDDLRAYRPDLVMVHVSAFGRTGPYAERPGFARVAEAFAGLTYRTGDPDRPPVFSGYPVADGVTGIYAAFAALLALRQRDLTGAAQLADIPLYEPLLRMMEDFVVEYGATGASRERQGNENPHISPNNLYRTRDGRWLALPASTEQMWRRLVGVMDAPDLAVHDFDDRPAGAPRGDRGARRRLRRGSRPGAADGLADRGRGGGGAGELGGGRLRRPAHPRPRVGGGGAGRRLGAAASHAGPGRPLLRLRRHDRPRRTGSR